MSCDTFQDRMQELLDQRASLRDDPDLRQHTDQCEECRNQLQMWEAIESTLTPSAGVVRQDSVANQIPVYAVATIAASLLFALTFMAGKQIESARSIPAIAQVQATVQPGLVEPFAATASVTSVDAELSPEAIEWWQSIGQREWFAESIPAMRSLDEGVAPLRRSIIQVVQILTFGDVYQTS